MFEDLNMFIHFNVVYCFSMSSAIPNFVHFSKYVLENNSYFDLGNKEIYNPNLEMPIIRVA